MNKSLRTIDGFGPLPVEAPATAAETGEIVRGAAARGASIYPVGGGTMLDLGLCPAKQGIIVALRCLSQIIDYPARDMTVTVEAGITVGRLQALLHAEKQRLPVDVPSAVEATLGGALAVNASGPRRFGYGTLRDYVIGISVVNDEGQETKAGGRVVKNVAGYDLCKLHVGSLGTLGIISQVTLKLRPLPEEQALILIGCTSEALAALLETLHATRTQPVCIDLLNHSAATTLFYAPGPNSPAMPWALVIGYEHNRETVSWQVQQLLKELPAENRHGADVRLGTSAEPLWRALTDFPTQPGAALVFKANVLPSATAAFCRQASELGAGIQLQAHAGNGIVIGRIEGDLTLERAAAMLKSLHEVAAAAAGNVLVLRCPAAWKKTLPVWGIPRGDAWLMRRVKRQLDPRGLFNPGRFVEGI